MRVAYVDTSALLAVLFGEPSATRMQAELNSADELISSNLLEAELRAAFKREDVEFDEDVLTALGWVMPNRPLTHEIEAVLAAGYLRGADLWHLACALYVEGRAGELTFLTMDGRQREVAEALGFKAHAP